jgi:hypothetical protein
MAPWAWPFLHHWQAALGGCDCRKEPAAAQPAHRQHHGSSSWVTHAAKGKSVRTQWPGRGAGSLAVWLAYQICCGHSCSCCAIGRDLLRLCFAFGTLSGQARLLAMLANSAALLDTAGVLRGCHHGGAVAHLAARGVAAWPLLLVLPPGNG